MRRYWPDGGSIDRESRSTRNANGIPLGPRLDFLAGAGRRLGSPAASHDQWLDFNGKWTSSCASSAWYTGVGWNRREIIKLSRLATMSGTRI